MMLRVAGPTRLELATSCVTGRRSNQLNYDPGFSKNYYDLNSRPSRPKRDVLTNLPAGRQAELRPRLLITKEQFTNNKLELTTFPTSRRLKKPFPLGRVGMGFYLWTKIAIKPYPKQESL